MKPRVFIGSSSEGLKHAKAIHYNLTKEAECTVWNQGIFNLSQSTLSDLMRVLWETDFAIFVFAPDDIAIMRGTASNVVRDNVIFELGLFMGRLGTERCFFLIPDNAVNFRLPSDLAGRKAGMYEGDRRDGNLFAATGPACTEIAERMALLGTIPAVHAPGATHSTIAVTAPGTEPVLKPAERAAKARSASPGNGTGNGEGIEARNYKSMIILTGDTKPAREILKTLKGRWIQKLGGWTIDSSNLSDLLKILPKVNYVNEEWEGSPTERK